MIDDWKTVLSTGKVLADSYKLLNSRVKNMQALLVEDSPTQAMYYRDVLNRLGLDVQVVGDGRAALSYAYEHRPDLIILDVNLPDMDGFQICSRLRRTQETCSIPIIMLTERSTSDDVWHGLQAGAADYIPKNEFAADALSASIRQLNVGG